LAYSAYSQSEATPEDTFKAGAAAFQSGNFEEAAKKFEVVLAAAPTGEALDTILFTLASTYFNQKNLPKAEDFYKRSIKEFPDGKNNTKALIAVSQIQSQTGRKAEAEATLKKASEGTGDLALRARMAQASMLAESGKPTEAVAVLRPMIVGGIKDDLSAQAAMAIVEIQSKQGNLDEALKLLDQLQGASDLIDNPLQLDILSVRIGDGLLGKGERQKALRMYAIVRPKQVVTDLQKKRIEKIDKTIADNMASLQKNPKAFMEVNATNARLKEDQKQLQTILEQFEKLPDTELPVRLRQAKAYDELEQKWETILIWESLLESSKDPKIREDGLFSIAAAYCALARSDDSVPALEKYSSEFPSGKYASQAAYLKGAVALEAGDFPKAESVFGERILKGDTNSLAGDMQFLLANTQFAQAAADPEKRAKYTEAIGNYKTYLSKYPNGKFAEESTYRVPLCSFQLGDYGKSMEGFQDYAKKFPKGTFIGDAGYRIALCYQAANKYDDVIRLCNEWLKQHEGESMQAEVLSLKGDAYDKKEMAAESAAAYRDSVNFADNDDLLKYSLFQANTQYQKLNRWDDIAEMFNRFIERHPKHPAVVASVYWVSKAKIKQGKPEEAKKYLADNILKNIGDRQQDAVEQLLTQLSQICAKRPRPSLIASQNASPQQESSPKAPGDASASPTPRPSPTPLPPYDADADFAKYLSESSAGNTPLAKARMRFALAQLAGYTKRQDRQKELMASIYKDFPANQLSAMLLSECGQIALERGDADKAEAFFKELMTSFPKSDLLEYAYCGMGQVSLARNQPEEALKWFDDAVNKAFADATLAQVTYGKGKALLAQGKFDEAKKIFEQVASTKDWRGEITAKALMSLGDLEEKRGKTDAAIQYYQRVFVAYQRYPAVVIPAYIKAADAFIKLNKPEDAAKDLKDMLSKPRLAASPLAEEARKKLDALPVPPPVQSGTATSQNPPSPPSTQSPPAAVPSPSKP
jgi:tetratricopeptide (TPR) repeat protein